MKTTLRALSVALALAVTLPGCFKKEATVHFQVDVRTNQGDPVAAAQVAVDGTALGTTDDRGRFAGDAQLPVGAKRRLEVRKESESYYFAPYYERFTVGGGGAQELSFSATLYFVPKPAPEGGPTRASETLAAAKAAAAATVATPESEVVDEAAGAQLPQETPAAERSVGAQPPQEKPDLPTPQVAAAAAPAQQGGVGAQPPQEKRDLPTPQVATAAAPAQPAAAAVVSKDTVARAADAAADDALDQAAGVTPPAPKEAKAPDLPRRLPAATKLVADAPAPEAPAAPKAPHATPTRGPVLYTVHVTAGETPVAAAEVALGEDGASDLKTVCHTNARGRCVVHFPAVPEAPVVFVASKAGFKTASVTATVKDKDQLRIPLDHGHTLDVFAMTRAYNHSAGLKGVEVYVAGRKVGVTDRFGRFSQTYDGKADDLLAISLRPQGVLPETFETDFVAAGEMTLVKFFTPAEPPAVRLTVLNAAAADAAFDTALRASVRKYVFASAAFKEYPLPLYQRAATRTGKRVSDFLRTGWRDTDLKAVVDAVLVPTVVPGPKPGLELSVVDSRGKILAAAREDLDSLTDQSSIDRAAAMIAKKITRTFPFEGAVLAKEGSDVTVNIGSVHGRGLKPGDVLDVYGTQAGRLGRSQLHGRIATLTVKEVGETESRCHVVKLVPRAAIGRGDLVALRTRKAPDAGAAELKVVDQAGSHQPVAQANVYLNDVWIGATDEAGKVYVDTTGTGTLKIVKQGFTAYAKPASFAAKAKVDVALAREAAFLRVESKPAGATVKVDGKVVGKTPLAAPVSVPSGFVKLELSAPGGFKTFSQVLELDQGTLDLTGDRAIAMEEDYLAIARRQLKAGRTDDALETLARIPKDHSDYLMGRHEAGEIYLTVLDQPAKAAEAFAHVTANEAVKTFADKRFIGSHVDEGIALFETAERLAKDQPDAARAHYAKALQILDAVVPYLRFVPADGYAQAVHEVDFHRALCRHRLWVSTQDPRYLAETLKSWRSYLDGSARSVPATDGTSKAYVENAEIYYKQAQASLAAPRNVSRQ